MEGSNEEVTEPIPLPPPQIIHSLALPMNMFSKYNNESTFRSR